MNKILFVGDTHFQSESPSSRKENPEQFRIVQLSKLQCILDLCISNGVDNVIILGDVYNSSINIYNPFLTKLYQ